MRIPVFLPVEKIVRILLIASSVVALPLASAAEINTVIVTAQKREQNIQNVPVAVSALSGDQLTTFTVSDVFDLQQNVPSLIVRQNQVATSSTFSIRGVGTSGSNFGLESSVGLYVDGVYRARQNSMINELVDMDAVEVLRGPQGTLFGRNTSSGAVLMKTVAPQQEFGGYIDADFGNYGLWSLNAAIGGPIVEDTLAYRLTGFTTRRDGYVEEINTGDDLINDRDRQGGRLQFLYTPKDSFSARLIVDYAEIDEICCGNATVRNNYYVYAQDGLTGEFDSSLSAGTDTILGTPSSILFPGTPVSGFGANIIDESQKGDNLMALNRLPVSQSEDGGISLELNFDAFGGEMTSITAYREFDSYDDLDGDFTDADIFSRSQEAEQNAFTQEIRLHLSEDQYDLIVGAYYFEQDLNIDSYTVGWDALNNLVALNIYAQAASLGELVAAAAVSGDTASAAALAASAEEVYLTATAAVIGLENAPLSINHPLYPLQLAGYNGVAFPSGVAGQNIVKQDHSAWAIYGQWDYQLEPDLTLTLGARYTEVNKDIAGIYTQPGSSWGALLGLEELTVINARPPVDESLSDEQITGTVKLSWRPSDEFLLYASYATGYKSGGTNTDRIDPSLSVLFDAETSETYEVGVKADIPAMNMRVNLALHHTTTDDYQSNAFKAIGFNLTNAGRVEAQGGELELWWNPIEPLSITAAYVYNEAEFKGFEEGNCWISYSWLTGIQDPGRAVATDDFCSRSGDPLDTNPEHTYLLAATYVTEVSQGLRVYVHGDYNYRSKEYMDSNLDPFKLQKGYGRLNARAGLKLVEENLDVSLWARNLLDESYFQIHNDVALQFGRLNAYHAEPRTYGVSLTKTF